MRYLFRGLIRDTGRAVEGHVEGATQDEALDALSTNGIVTESLAPDPKPLNMNDELPTAPEFADALESAFDSSSSQVDFDALTQRYTGKKVWVIDRDKIKRRVGQVVDAALALSAQHGEGPGMARERVANAITGLFSDNRNIASERNADSMAGVRFNESANQPAPPPPPMPAMRQVNGNGNGNGAGYAAVPAGGHPGLENQVARIANLVKQAEAALAAVSAAARRASLGGGGGGGGGGGRRFSPSRRGGGEEQNGVLLEIFKSNLALVRGMQSAAEAELAPPVTEAPTSDQPPEPPAMESVSSDAFPPPPQPPELVGAGNES